VKAVKEIPKAQTCFCKSISTLHTLVKVQSSSFENPAGHSQNPVKLLQNPAVPIQLEKLSHWDCTSRQSTRKPSRCDTTDIALFQKHKTEKGEEALTKENESLCENETMAMAFFFFCSVVFLFPSLHSFTHGGGKKTWIHYPMVTRFMEKLEGNCRNEGTFCVRSNGTCNNETGECECPKMFSGQDDWNEFNACQVNVRHQQIVHVFAAAIAFVGMLVCLKFLVEILMAWKIKAKLNRTENNVTPPSSSEQGSNELSSRSVRNPPKSDIFGNKRSWIIAGVGFGLMATFGFLTYFSSLAAGISRSDQFFWLDASMFLGSSSLFASLWAFTFAFYLFLPSLKTHRRILNIDSVLVRKPQWIRRATQFRILLSFFVGWLFVLVLPYVFEAKNAQNSFDTVVLASFGLFAFDHGVFTLILVRFLQRILTSVHDFGTSSFSDREKAGMDLSLKVVRATSFVLLLEPIAGLVLILTAFKKEFRMLTFLGFTLPMVTGICGIVFVVVVLQVYRRSRREYSR